jgi:hypothetical protein
MEDDIMLGSEWKVIKGVFKPWHEDVIIYEDNSTEWRMDESHFVAYRINGDIKGEPIYIHKDDIKVIGNKDVVTVDDDYIYINNMSITKRKEIREDIIKLRQDTMDGIFNPINIKNIVIPYDIWKVIMNGDEILTFKNEGCKLTITDDCGLNVTVDSNNDYLATTFIKIQWLSKIKVYKGDEIKISFADHHPMVVDVEHKGMSWSTIVAPYFDERRGY